MEVVRASESSLLSALTTQPIQEAFRDRLATVAIANGRSLTVYSPQSAQNASDPADRATVAAPGVDTIFEVAITKVSTAGFGIDPPLELSLEARLRAVRAGDHAQLFEMSYVHTGPRRRLSEWAANDAEALLHALNEAYDLLAAQIYENVFLLYPYPDRQPHFAGFMAAAFGLAPIRPRTRLPMARDDAWPNAPFTKVDSLRPMLEWEVFPRTTDLEQAPEDMTRITNVRYDLVIAREHEFAPAEITYRREKLPTNLHGVEAALAPATRYFWTIRARFELDGTERVTEWSSTHFSVRERATAPSQWSYRFRTP